MRGDHAKRDNSSNALAKRRLDLNLKYPTGCFSLGIYQLYQFGVAVSWGFGYL